MIAYLRGTEDPREARPPELVHHEPSRYPGGARFEVGLGTGNPAPHPWKVTYPGPHGTVAVSPLRPDEAHVIMRSGQDWYEIVAPPTPLRVGNGWPQHPTDTRVDGGAG